MVILNPKEGLKEGIELLYNAVSSTLGNNGKLVIIKEGDITHITKDGATVANYVHSKEPLQQLGIDLLRQATLEANKIVGDGSTTTTVLAYGLSQYPTENQKEVINNIIIPKLEEQAKKIDNADAESILKVAEISSNGDKELSKLISEPFIKYGKQVLINIKEGDTTHIESSSGFKLDAIMVSKFFHDNTGQSTKVSYKQSNIIILEKKPSSINDIAHNLKEGVPNIIVVPDIEENLIALLLQNVYAKKIYCNVIKFSNYREHSRDIINDLKVFLGNNPCNVEINEHYTLFTNNKSNEAELESRINILQEEIDKSTEEITKRKLEERKHNLLQTVYTLYIGGNSELEIKEKIDRAEDAVNAVKAALEDGVIQGGGVPLMEIGKSIQKEYPNLCKAISLPYLLISNNESLNIKDNTALDPVKVTKTALITAASVVETINQSNTVIIYETI